MHETRRIFEDTFSDASFSHPSGGSLREEEAHDVHTPNGAGLHPPRRSWKTGTRTARPSFSATGGRQTKTFIRAVGGDCTTGPTSAPATTMCTRGWQVMLRFHLHRWDVQTHDRFLVRSSRFAHMCSLCDQGPSLKPGKGRVQS